MADDGVIVATVVAIIEIVAMAEIVAVDGTAAMVDYLEVTIVAVVETAALAAIAATAAAAMVAAAMVESPRQLRFRRMMCHLQSSEMTTRRQWAEVDSMSESRRPAEAAWWRTIASLLIFIHLFFVFLALSSNLARSGLSRTLLSRFAFYTRLFNFDLDFTPYHLTHGTDEDVDHRVEVLLTDASSWETLPSGMRGHDGYKRVQRFAANWAYHALNDGQPALFAQAVANRFSQQQTIAPKQVRCRKHFQQGPDDLVGTPAQRDPDDSSRFSVPYAATSIIRGTGAVEVIRVEEAGQVAAPATSTGAARGNNAR
jgi:hypothetical protein